MALAIKFQGMVDRGEVRDYADLARLGYVTRARVTQIMNLVNLAPDIQALESSTASPNYLHLRNSKIDGNHRLPIRNRAGATDGRVTAARSHHASSARIPLYGILATTSIHPTLSRLSRARFERARSDSSINVPELTKGSQRQGRRPSGSWVRMGWETARRIPVAKSPSLQLVLGTRADHDDKHRNSFPGADGHLAWFAISTSRA
jgi:hypothetical protein